MKKVFSILIMVALGVGLVLSPVPASATDFKDTTRFYKAPYFLASQMGIRGVLYTMPSADGTAGQVLKTNGSKTLSWTAAGAATTLTALGAASADGSTALTGYKHVFTSTLNSAGANFTLTNTTADLTADVSFIDFKYTDDGDANGFFMRGYDNAGNDLKWSIGADGAVSFGASTLASAAVTGAITGATVATTGITTATGGLSAGSAADSTLKTDTITITNAQLKALRATPKTLVAAPAAGSMIEFISAVIAMNYGSNVLSETADNLQVQYNTSNLAAAAVIETTGFLDQNADMIAICTGTDIAGAAATSFVARALELKNTGDGEFGGNAGNDTTLIVKVTYRIHVTGL